MKEIASRRLHPEMNSSTVSSINEETIIGGERDCFLQVHSSRTILSEGVESELGILYKWLR